MLDWREVREYDAERDCVGWVDVCMSSGTQKYQQRDGQAKECIEWPYVVL